MKALAFLLTLLAVVVCAIGCGGGKHTLHSDLTSWDNYVPLDSVDVGPRMVKQQPLSYPEVTRLASIQGSLFVRVLVNTAGKVLDAEIAQSSGNAALDQAALQAAPHNRFKPAVKDGKPVATKIVYKVTYAVAQKR